MLSMYHTNCLYLNTVYLHNVWVPIFDIGNHMYILSVICTRTIQNFKCKEMICKSKQWLRLLFYYSHGSTWLFYTPYMHTYTLHCTTVLSLNFPSQHSKLTQRDHSWNTWLSEVFGYCWSITFLDKYRMLSIQKVQLLWRFKNLPSVFLPTNKQRN